MRSRYFPDDYSDDEFDLWLKHIGPARLESEFDAIRARIGTATERPEDPIAVTGRFKEVIKMCPPRQ
jgi:hypothetical protein